MDDNQHSQLYLMADILEFDEKIKNFKDRKTRVGIKLDCMVEFELANTNPDK